MSDDIKKQIAKTSDRTKVFGLLRKLTQKLTHVEFRSSSANGEFMIEKGTRIFWAKSDGDGDSGMMAMMKLLAAQKITFGVMPSPVEKPKSNVDISLEELVADEGKVIQQIKDVLWPVNESNVETEAAITPLGVETETAIPALPVNESNVETETAITPLPAPEELASLQSPAESETASKSQPTQEELNMLEQMVLQAAAEQEAAKAAGVEPEPKPRRNPIPEPRGEMILEQAAEDDDIMQKRRAEMRALEVWCGEEPEKFFDEQEQPIEDDDLLSQRRKEMEALNAMLEAHANLTREIFHDKRPDEPDIHSDKRRKEFEALKEYFAENPDRFYEYVALGEEDFNGSEELRAKILNIMAATRDVDAFEAKDPRIETLDQVLYPTRAPEDFQPPKAETAEPEPSLTQGSDDEYVPPDVEPSPYGDDTSKLNYEEKHKNKLDLSQSTDDKSLIRRDPDRNNNFGWIDRSKLRVVEKIPKQALIAAAVFACLMPIIALYLYHYFNMNAEADYEDQRAASELAARAAQEESTARKPEQSSYRTAEAGPVNATPPAVHAAENSTVGQGGVSEAELSSYRWVPPTHPQPQPSRPQQEKAQRCLVQGETLLTNGQPDEAAKVFADGLLDCPTNSQLRVRLARAYIMLRQYGAAKDVLLSGMHNAANQGEFEMYVNIMRELPRI